MQPLSAPIPAAPAEPPATRLAAEEGKSFGRAWAAFPWVVVAGAAAAAGIWPDASSRWAAWPFLISAAVLGMPHGALDLRLALRVSEGWSGRAMLAAGYLAISAAAFAVLWWLPLLAIAAFGCLTVVHFGAADARDAAMIAGETPPRGVALWVTATGRGAFLLSLPFAWDPGGAMLPVQTALDLLERDAISFSFDAVRNGGAIAAGVGLIVIAIGVGLTRRATLLRSTGKRKESHPTRLVITHVGEAGLLAAAAAVLEPMFFVGLYFLAWHSVRHLRRAALLSGEKPRRPIRTALRQIGRAHV
jgi:beta-carotene 15,15'-dioxygenase